MKKRYIALGFVFSLVLVFNGSVYYMDQQLAKKETNDVYKSCNKIWSSRGLYNSHAEQNTLLSVKRAFDVGISGVEVDVFYDVRLSKFIVSHDKPLKGKNGENIYTLKEGEILTLEKLLKTLGQKHYFWVDYKNLDRITESETIAAIERLNKITSEYHLKERLYVEGSNPIKLSMYAHAGIKTIFGIHPLPDDNIFSSIILKIYKLAFFFSDFSVLAMPYGTLEEPIFINDTQKSLAHIPSFIFHVPNDEALLNGLIRQKDVRVILVGRDTSINRVNMNTCQD